MAPSVNPAGQPRGGAVEHNGPWMKGLIKDLEEALERPFDPDDIDALDTEWQHAVANGETIVGLKDWIIAQTEAGDI